MIPQSLTLTYEDFLDFPDNGKRHELIDGEQYVTPSPLTKHQKRVATLPRLLGTFVFEHQLGTILSAPMDVVLSDRNVVEPDFLFLATSRSSIITEANIQGPPDLVVEILSESTRKTDEIIKRKLYEKHQVEEYSSLLFLSRHDAMSLA